MAECFKCGRDMTDADGCDADRTITFDDGTEHEPIPHGDADRDRSYQDVIDEKERQIENGGRGNLSPDDVREELQQFKARYDEAEYNDRRCLDCGVAMGEHHHPGCDHEECPRCGEQYFVCGCATDEKRALWNSA